MHLMQHQHQQQQQHFMHSHHFPQQMLAMPPPGAGFGPVAGPGPFGSLEWDNATEEVSFGPGAGAAGGAAAAAAVSGCGSGWSAVGGYNHGNSLG